MTSETRVVTLAEFLLARIAEDEDAARREPGRPMYGGGNFYVDAGPNARALAECEAKRRIIEIHAPYTYAPPAIETKSYCTKCHHDQGDWNPPGMDDWPCGTIFALAQPYADHPDFREEWRITDEPPRS
jgi:hypothetical protein